MALQSQSDPLLGHRGTEGREFESLLAREKAPHMRGVLLGRRELHRVGDARVARLRVDVQQFACEIPPPSTTASARHLANPRTPVLTPRWLPIGSDYGALVANVPETAEGGGDGRLCGEAD